MYKRRFLLLFSLTWDSTQTVESVVNILLIIPNLPPRGELLDFNFNKHYAKTQREPQPELPTHREKPKILETTRLVKVSATESDVARFLRDSNHGLMGQNAVNTKWYKAERVILTW